MGGHAVVLIEDKGTHLSGTYSSVNTYKDKKGNIHTSVTTRPPEEEGRQVVGVVIRYKESTDTAN